MKTLFALSLRRRLLLSAALALFLLVAAYVLQYLLGYQPCSLCLKQRIVWWLLLVITIPSWLPEPLLPKRALQITALTASLLALAGGALALFHAGGERGWWRVTLLCEGFSFDPDTSPEDLHTMLLSREAVPCDEPALRLFGLSLSEYNALFSFFVLGWLLQGALSRRA